VTALGICTACVKVIHDEVCDAGGIVVGGGGEPAHAQALIVLNLERSAANLTGTYASILAQLNGDLQGLGVVVDEWAVLPLYGAVTTSPALIYGFPSTGGDLATALSLAALSGHFDKPIAGATAEQYNLADLAQHLDTATLPPELTGGESKAFFSPPKDLFFIVTIQTAQRTCADTDPACAVSGQSPNDVFTATDSDGNAAWLKLPGGSPKPGRIYQAFIATSEQEAADAFANRCKMLPGFPATLLDVLQPSPVPYYVDLQNTLAQKGWPGERIDLCEAVSAMGTMRLKDLATHIRDTLKN
jgi:hypothetical protein